MLMMRYLRCLSGLLSWLCRPLSGMGGLFFALMYLVGATSVGFEPWNGSRFWMLFELFADLYVVCLLLMLLPSRWRGAGRVVCAAATYLLSAVDMACYVRVGMPITPMLVQLVMQTNGREATEALVAYADGRMLLSPLSLVLVQAVVGLWCLCRPSACGRVLTRLSAPVAPWLRGALRGAVAFLLVVGVVSSAENKAYLYYRIARQYSELDTQRVRDFHQRTNYYLPIYRLAFALAETGRLRGELTRFSHSLSLARVDSVSPRPPHVVVIFGESYNRHHSALYGYARATTPRQCARWARGEMVRFDDVISSWNTTCESFQNMLSSQCVGMAGTWASAPPFPLLFRKAGFRVTFLSNQYVVGQAGFSAFVEDAFFNNPATSHQLFDRRNDRLHAYDGDLLRYLPAPRSESGRPQLTLIHFLGLHAAFDQRYPHAFAHFGAGSYHRPDLTDGDRAVLAAYDNAVYYNDYVVDRILRHYEGTDAVVVFVPDHGERVFDTSNEWGRNLSWSPGDLRQQFEIPFWIWGSPIYRRRHPQQWRQIESAAPRRAMTDALPHLLYHLAGIHTPWYHARYDLLSPHYDACRPRIIRGERDYDRLKNNSVERQKGDF